MTAFPVPLHPDKPIGVLLAGGLARRMGGGDKTLKEIGHRPILDHVIARFAPQCAQLVLNINGPPERFARYGLPVVADTIPDHAGPLAGILAALDWVAQNYPECPTVASVAADSPFLPTDLVKRLEEARRAAKTPLACAQSAERIHPPFAVWPVSLRHALRDALLNGNMRRMDTFMANTGCAYASWDSTPYDPFFNTNHPEDLQKAEIIWSTLLHGPASDG